MPDTNTVFSGGSCSSRQMRWTAVSTPWSPQPEHQRGFSVAYCDAPGPLEKGGETFYAISPTPSDWSPERAETFYREYNDYMLENLTVHEAMPGH